MFEKKILLSIEIFPFEFALPRITIILQNLIIQFPFCNQQQKQLQYSVAKDFVN